MSILRVLHAAPAMQYQDLGRFGHGHLGISQGGPLDLHAHCWANYLLNNPSHSTTIEISYGNAHFITESDCTVALAGADMNAKINGRNVQNWSTHQLSKGQSLKLSYATKGIHAYLAIQEGFRPPSTLSSRSTVLRNNIGSLIKEGTELPYSNSHQLLTVQKSTPSHFIPNYDKTSTIRVISPDERLTEQSYTISQHSDRMGINLIAENQERAKHNALPGIISEGIGIGTIQLPPSGNPIALLNDRQTQGGYAKIGTIAKIDLPLLAQSRPGTTIQFIPLDLNVASDEWFEFCKFFSL